MKNRKFSLNIDEKSFGNFILTCSDEPSKVSTQYILTFSFLHLFPSHDLYSVAEAVRSGLGKMQKNNYGVNQGHEQTWHCAKNGENKIFEKRIPGVNAYT